MTHCTVKHIVNVNVSAKNTNNKDKDNNNKQDNDIVIKAHNVANAEKKNTNLVLKEKVITDWKKK